MVARLHLKRRVLGFGLLTCLRALTSNLLVSKSLFVIQPWSEKGSSEVHRLVTLVQRGRQADFNPEGEEEEDLGWPSAYYDGDEGQLFVAIGPNDELLACAAVITGTAVATTTSGASTSEAAVAAIRRVCLNPAAVVAGTGERENILEALVQEAHLFVQKHGMQRVIGLGYDGTEGCQPSPQLLEKLGYEQQGRLPGCPGVFQYSQKLLADMEPKRSLFTGNWKMDLSSSDSLWGVLRAVGMNFLAIPLVDRLSVQQGISQTEDGLTIEITTPLGSDTMELPFDGAVTMVSGVAGGKNMQTSSWISAPAGGQLRLKTVQAVKGSLDLPGSSTLFETVRSLGDGDATLFEDLATIVNGQRVATARRVLRRLED